MNKITRVMIVDDEPVVGERLKASLERVGFTVDTFSSSREAIAGLKQSQYDILVTDLKMSGPDGLEILRTARQLHPDIKPVVITGFATNETAEEVMQSGAVRFIAKPFKMSQLKSVLFELSGRGEDSNE